MTLQAYEYVRLFDATRSDVNGFVLFGEIESC